jgi:CubicO group peptidase (beta-lactamase class C family)
VPELVDDLARVRIRRPRRRYSNFSAALLGQALAACAGAPYEQLVEERVLRPLGIQEVWARNGPSVAQPHDRHGRPVAPWTFDAYAPGRLPARHRPRCPGALNGLHAAACRNGRGRHARPHAAWGRPDARDGLGWLHSPAHRDARMWWHNGGTHGCRSFTAFIPETGQAVAAVANSAKPVEKAAKAAW